MKNLVIFASGSGTNAENLIRYFNEGNKARVVAIFCNNPNAGIILRAEKYDIPVHLFTKKDLNLPSELDSLILNYKPDLIVLAGFLWLFPTRLLHQYPNRVVNIHPALLPKYGGKGMYGNHIHSAVLANKEAYHGVTVHLVNEEYDKGEIILQQFFEVAENENLDSLEEKIHEMEFKIFPKAIEKLMLRSS